MLAEKIDKENVEKIYDLSPMQQGFLYEYIIHPLSHMNIEQVSFSINSKIDHNIIEKAWNYVVDNNEMLRTVIRYKKIAKPVQIVLKMHPIRIKYYYLEDMDEELKNQAFQEILRNDLNEGVDIETQPFRLKLCKLAENRFIIIITIHHIIYDAWSGGILMKEFADYLNIINENKEPARINKTSYREFLNWCKASQKNNKEYWNLYLNDFKDKTSLPTWCKKESRPIINSTNYPININEKSERKINQYIKNHHVTLNSVFCAAWAIFLQKINETDDVLFGLPVSGRPVGINGIDQMVGLFINTLPLRIKTKKQINVLDFIKSVQKTIFELQEHQDTSLHDIMECGGVDRTQGLFDSILSLQTYPLVDMYNDPLLSCDYFSVSEMPNFDLSLCVMPFNGVTINFIYNLDLFDEETIAFIAEKFIYIVNTMIEQPYKNLPDWDIFTKKEISKFNENNKHADYPKNENDDLTFIDIPVDYNRPLDFERKIKRLDFQADTITSEALSELMVENNVNSNILTLALFSLFLSKYSGQEVIPINCPYVGQLCTDLQKTIGNKEDAISINVHTFDNNTFVDLLIDVQENVLKTVPSAHKSNVGKTFSLACAFLTTDDLMQNPNYATSYDLALQVVEKSGKFSFVFMYCTELFKKTTIQRMANHFINICNNVIQNPNEPLSNLTLLSDSEVSLLQETFNATEQIYPKDKLVTELFEKQVQLYPNHIALNYYTEELTFSELNQKINILALKLRQLSTRINGYIALMIEPSLEMIIGIVGVLKSGNAFVPIDTNYPKERICSILKDLSAEFILTQKINLSTKSVIDEIMQDIDITCLTIEDILQNGGSIEIENPTCLQNPEDTACIIYTSGSTGMPKGNMITHRNIIQTLINVNYIDISASDIILQASNYTFDAALFNIFSALLYGAKLVLIQKNDIINVNKLANIIIRERVSLFCISTAFFNTLIDVNLSCLCNVRKILFGGETASITHVKKAFDFLGKNKLINVYGPSENTIITTAYEVSDIEENIKSISIGKPISGAKVHILDKCGRLQPVGVIGELYISGHGLCNGYLNREDLTREKYFYLPFLPNELVYKTGDFARWLDDGNIEFIGRKDNQIKIRGFRIELEEIEEHMRKYPSVNDAVVITQEDNNNNLHLHAFYTSNQPLNHTQLKKQLVSFLPDHMIPEAFTYLERIPLTPNGKVDKRQLKENISVNNNGINVLPKTKIEQTLNNIWQKVLGKSNFGTRDRFFDVGGNSLLLMKLQYEIEKELCIFFNTTDLFQFPTIETFAAHLNQITYAEDSQEYSLVSNEYSKNSNTSIAVVGMAGKFPGAENIQIFWDNLVGGKETIQFFDDEQLDDSGISPKLYKNPQYVKAGGIIKDIEYFDAAFFGFNPKEAEITDPQHRLFLECAWEAIEDAGYDPQRYGGSIGVFAGCSMNSYFINIMQNSTMLETVNDMQTLIANDKDFLPTRVSYKLNLKGPSVNVQTACSTSLVAIHMACKSILNDECHMALAGGICIKVPKVSGYLYRTDGIQSPDGHCRVFDKNAQGTVPSNGVGVVLLKRMEDAIADGDHIYATILGSAINNDGASKIGYTAPSVDGQAAVIENALKAAGIRPDSVGYVEAHGTGTILGDPIEISALNKAYGNKNAIRQPCAIGSVKSNVGHLDAAAGVTGFIKTVLILKNKLIPPSLHFKEPNLAIDYYNGNFYVNDKLTKWESKSEKLYAGVSSFGIGGTNAHVILENVLTTNVDNPSRSWQIITMSAKTNTALDKISYNLVHYFEKSQNSDFADEAYTSKVGKSQFDHRRAFVCRDKKEAGLILKNKIPNKVFTEKIQEQNNTVFMFTGQGAQYVNMAYDLYKSEKVFKAHIDICLSIVEKIMDINIIDLIYPEKDNAESSAKKLMQTKYAQPAIFIIEYAMAKLLMHWGVKPDCMIGHSLGEYVAACLAEVFTLEDALKLIVERAKLMQMTPEGAMISVRLGKEAVKPFLYGGISLAAINSEDTSVISGDSKYIRELCDHLKEKGITYSELKTSRAFHSSNMDGIIQLFIDCVNQIKLNPPKIKYISNLTGTWITESQAVDPVYWGQHLRETVLFAQGISVLKELSNAVFIEIGPGMILNGILKNDLKDNVVSAMRHKYDKSDDLEYLSSMLCKLWVKGIDIDWFKYYSEESRKRISLPTYPFERKKYWLDNKAGKINSSVNPIDIECIDQGCGLDHNTVSMYDRPLLSDELIPPQNDVEIVIAGLWQELLGIKEIGIYDDFFKLGGHSLLGTQLMSRINVIFQTTLPLKTVFEKANIRDFAETIVEEKGGEIAELIASTYLKLAKLSEEEVKKLLTEGVVEH